MSRGFGVSVAALILTAAGCGQSSFSATPSAVMVKVKEMEGDSLVMVRLAEGRASEGKLHLDEECTDYKVTMHQTYGIKRKPRNEKLYVRVKDGRPVDVEGVFIDMKVSLCEGCLQ